MRVHFCVALLLLACPTAGQETKPPQFSETTEVTASRNQESLLEAPVSISVIDQKQIETSAADNYADLLRGVPGLNVVQTSARDVGIRSRGSSGVAEHRQLTLLDGRPVYLDFYGVVLWDFLPVNFDEIKQIEILRGPGSAIWGANALSGVINVRTKSPRELKGGLITLTGGEQHTRAIAMRFAQAFDRFSYKASASYYEQNVWKRDAQLLTFDNEGTRQPKADVRVDWGTESVPLWSYKIGYGGSTGIFHSRLGPFLIRPGTYVGYGEIDRSTNTLDARVYWNRLKGDAPNLLNGLDFSFRTDTYAADVTGRRAVGSKQILVYGGDVRASRFDLSIAPRGDSRNASGFFVEDSAILHRNISLNVGARVDHFDPVGTTLSPRTSLIFKPRSNQSIRLAYNSAYRAPSIVDNFLQTSIPNAYGGILFRTAAAGNENLRAEFVSAVEAGYTLAIGSRELFTASIYRNNVKNNIVFVPTAFYSQSDPPPGWPRDKIVPSFTLTKAFGFVNVGKEKDAGVELSWDMNWSDAFLTRTSYTYEENPKVSNSGPIPLVVNRPPRHQASVLANFRAHRWFTSESIAYTDKAFWSDVLDSHFWGFTNAYTIVNAAIGMFVSEHAQVDLKATDLLDKKIKEHIFGDIIRRKATVELRYRF